MRNGIALTDLESKILDDLDSALNKLDSYKGTVTRSVSIYNDDLDYFLKDYKLGNVVNYRAYTSTTKGEMYNPDARVQINIKSKNGKNLLEFNEEEQEILFKRNSNFKVKNIDTRDDFLC